MSTQCQITTKITHNKGGVGKGNGHSENVPNHHRPPKCPRWGNKGVVSGRQTGAAQSGRLGGRSAGVVCGGGGVAGGRR